MCHESGEYPSYTIISCQVAADDMYMMILVMSADLSKCQERL